MEICFNFNEMIRVFHDLDQQLALIHEVLIDNVETLKQTKKECLDGLSEKSLDQILRLEDYVNEIEKERIVPTMKLRLKIRRACLLRQPHTTIPNSYCKPTEQNKNS